MVRNAVRAWKKRRVITPSGVLVTGIAVRPATKKNIRGHSPPRHHPKKGDPVRITMSKSGFVVGPVITTVEEDLEPITPGGWRELANLLGEE